MTFELVCTHRASAARGTTETCWAYWLLWYTYISSVEQAKKQNKNWRASTASSDMPSLSQTFARINKVNRSLHWGQGGKYPVGTCWTHCGHRQHLITMYPVTKSWAHYECLSSIWCQCAQWEKVGHILNGPYYVTPMWPTRYIFNVYKKYNHNVPSGKKLGTLGKYP